MKNCPFQKNETTCGDWCQLFVPETNECTFQKMEKTLGDVFMNMPDHIPPPKR